MTKLTTAHTATTSVDHDDLLSAAIRMFVGVTGKDAYGCEWYEGIEHDAAEELRAALAKAGANKGME